MSTCTVPHFQKSSYVHSENKYLTSLKELKQYTDPTAYVYVYVYVTLCSYNGSTAGCVGLHGGGPSPVLQTPTQPVQQGVQTHQ